ncbi:hypothetical protein DER46DRAFT_679198 [Fusarium sp. MPI-SDFR-AT-0072]|nr:hypothetical protein DER46DRAFT_679198 [Fusarium sp. MPI-SDFR-AT-0072]
MHDDSNSSLRNIVKNHGKSVTSLLLEIRKLECLRIDENSSEEPRLIRDKINAFQKQDYVALSYTWDNSDQENPENGKYQVQDRDNLQFSPSPVRDCVFDHMFSFMRAKGLCMLWIDRHCVEQRTCNRKGVCRHKRCNEKKRAIETMDLVYSLSKHPVALLGKPIEWEHELDLLFKILGRELVKELKHKSHNEILQALSLLTWTFQEDYRGQPEMTLLIRHPQFLEAKKQAYGRFSNVQNELCINSAEFCKVCTELCLEVQKTPQQDDVSHHTKDILGVAGNYIRLLDKSMPMTPKVIADIERRGLGDAWDKLAIIANCCQYAIRMNHMQMTKSKSLSVSILAMCLLNGEILWNETRENPVSMLDKTLSQFLEEQAFKGFCAPESERSLTFNKGCRFVDVKFTRKGIKTKGHLWKLGRIIDPVRFRLPLPEAKNKSCPVTQDEQRHLTHLAAELRRLHKATLAMHIERFLNYDPTRQEDNLKNKTFSRRYMRLMAEELVTAIKKGKLLRLGRIGRKPEWKFAFTASRPLERGLQWHGTNDLDHHVSLEVKWPSSRDHSPNELPQLLIKRWIVGLCFFYDFPRTDVIFPWPSSFNTIFH